MCEFGRITIRAVSGLVSACHTSCHKCAYTNTNANWHCCIYYTLEVYYGRGWQRSFL